MTTRRTIEALKHRIKRGLKVLGLYLLWQATGWTLTIFFFAILVGSGVKSIMAMPLSNIGPFDPLLMPFRMLHWHTTRFLIEHPTAWTVWQHLPGYDPSNPFTLFTPTWGGVLLVGLAGGYLVRKKVKEASPPASINTYHGDYYRGDVTMVNKGTVDSIGTIAGRHTNIALPSPKEGADALMQVAEAVQAEPTIDQAQRRAVLERLLWLAQQTEVPAADRAHTAIRTIVNDLDGALSVAGKLASVWTQWGKIIKTFFGISG
jgi:hypothetical protein